MNRQSEETAGQLVEDLGDQLKETDRWREWDAKARADGFRSLSEL